jgi:subtilisin family serine protease
MRKRHVALALAVVSAAGMIAGPVANGQPSSAAIETANAPTAHAITLITGDTVFMTTGADGRQAVDVKQGKGRESVNFLSKQDGQEVSVVPDDALPLINAGKLDAALFNITRLLQQGYGDQQTDSIPLIATYRTAAATRAAKAPEGAKQLLTLPAVHATALSERKASGSRFWKDIAPTVGTGRNPMLTAKAALGDGMDKLWLDSTVEASLDVSVPQIGAPEMWQAGFDGKGVEVAVLDTGVDLNHPDLAGQIADTKSFVDGVTSVQDGHGHGTHVASTVAGTGAASGGKYKGVAPGAQLLVGKVLNDAGRGSSSSILAGMEWAAASGADIVSMSLGDTAYGPSDPMSEAVDTLSAGDGPLFVIAAGNSGPAEGTVGTPGIADSALTVGAVSKTDVLASFSSRGPRTGDSAIKPEITAPGVSITAARATGTTMGTPLDDKYTAANGTSMATPHVAGAAAIVAQAHPDWTSAQLKSALASTAKTNTRNTVFQQGDGRVDVPRATTQGIFATPTLSYGLHDYDDSATVSKDITYSNTTKTPVTLQLSNSLDDGSFSLASDTVTVPANGTATVATTLDVAKIAAGRHTGYTTAASADGKISMTTGIAYEKGIKTYSLTVNLTGRDGNPAPYALYALQELDDAYPSATGFLPSSWTWQVPAGTYSIATWIPELDGAGIAVSQSIVGDPQIELTGDTTISLDARKANEIKLQTKERDAESGSVTTSWRRGMSDGRILGLTYNTGPWIKRFYAAPTETVTDGFFEFYSKWRLHAKELTASVTSPRQLSLSPTYMSTSTGFPVKISGNRKVKAVYAGEGTADAFQGLDVKGKAVLVGLPPKGWADEALANATAAGAAYLLAYRKESPGLWLTSVDSTTIPAISLTGEEGEQLASLLTSGKPVTLRLGGTAVSPYVYNLALPETGGISGNLTYPINSSTTAKVTARYHASAEGQMGYDGMYAYLPSQTIDFGLWEYVRLGTTRTEYYSANNTRFWHTSYQDWDSKGRQWSTLRSYQAGQTGTESWFAPVIRPATEAAYGSTSRTADQITVMIPEVSDSQPGHYGDAEPGTDTVTTRLYANGNLVKELPDASGTFDVGADKAVYSLTTDVTRTAAWAAYSTKTHTRWDFSSARPGQATVLPLLSVDYGLAGLDLLNRAKAGRHFGFGLSVRRQAGSGTAKIKKLKAWVSYDDGKTWKEVKISAVKGGGFQATMTHPTIDRTNGYVALRVQAADTEGNRINQTVLRAYGLLR